MTWELSDLLRAIATTIVICIHASHYWWFGVHDTTSINPEIFINTLINQVGRVAVPIFVILSGYALAKSEAKRPFNLQVFFQRRLWRILPPYILFTLLNMIGRPQFQTGNWLERGQQMWQALSTGSGDYHLYFLIIIFQCYVTYPILRRITFTAKRLYFLLVISLPLFSWCWISATLGYFPNIKIEFPDVIYWLPYFQIGIWLTKDRGWISQLVLKTRSRTWGYLFAIAATLELSEFYWTSVLKNAAEAVGHYNRPTVFLLSLTFLLWALSWQGWQIKAFPQFYQNPSFQNLWQLMQSQIKTCSQASFTVYLTHVWILRAITPLEVFGGFIYIPLALVTSWLGGIFAWQIIKKCRQSYNVFQTNPNQINIYRRISGAKRR